ncbi:leucyl/phenylalanyl-tRNA--protein transferase [Jejuia pallidilutea]|uniref:Leucyl/phenylalanyl-tRNA--protein transferase n=1 Tax=Jejuia pallidilutea TaxID=504487 RepID=A0A090WJM9_9FLAO|nr:leucyl/phenylalanyl-tRNA--protein transferase [Jejuia pallidilutea]GAL67667.1 leucyl/phenylalanyl-tRNA-protein transferase [Jejuia pallidilutea]GAL72036.1 leucyl/phenylalanyl-tRNA-protein transferase [Jejuia pallidilutea]GAL88372.1 leucyl/phenylalanyl-tRNA-protein transferase [Jejuia pallidilutea]
MEFLTEDLWFPDVSKASEEGIVAIGGDLSMARLLLAYRSGIFPWFENDEPILWWSPDPRFVLFPEKLKVSKSMRQVLRNKNYTVTVNKAFANVIASCAIAKRNGQQGTWITENMIAAFTKLHNMGYAKSVEVWHKDELVGGLYGVDLGNGIFTGESMFAKENNASKVGFITFIQNTNYKLIDCQVYTNHLASLGAEDIPRDTFLKLLKS